MNERNGHELGDPIHMTLQCTTIAQHELLLSLIELLQYLFIHFGHSNIRTILQTSAKVLTESLSLCIKEIAIFTGQCGH